MVALMHTAAIMDAIVVLIWKSLSCHSDQILREQRQELNCGSEDQNSNLKSLQHISPGCMLEYMGIFAALDFLFPSKHVTPQKSSMAMELEPHFH